MTDPVLGPGDTELHQIWSLSSGSPQSGGRTRQEAGKQNAMQLVLGGDRRHSFHIFLLKGRDMFWSLLRAGLKRVLINVC